MARKVKNWIDGFVECTENTEPRQNFRKWVAISTLAAVMQRKCVFNWGRERFFPNMYIVLVGPPAARKGTAMKEGKVFLDRLGIPVAADESSRQRLINNMREMTAADPDSQGELNYHSSLTIFSTELTTFLGYDNRELLSMLCKWFDCEDRFVYETVSRGKEEVVNVWANMLGATTPGQLQSSLPEETIGSGFASRVIFVYEDGMEKIVIQPSINAKMFEELVSDLEEVRQISGEFQYTPEYLELYTKWRSEEDTSVFTDSRLDYYIQRRPTHLFKLSMIYSAAKKDSKIIDVYDLQEAIEALHSVEENMCRVFEGVGKNPLAALQNRILMFMRQRGGRCDITDLAELFSNDASHKDLADAFDGLQYMGKLQIDMVNRKLYLTEKGK
jgi:hypothetical protein